MPEDDSPKNQNNETSDLPHRKYTNKIGKSTKAPTREQADTSPKRPHWADRIVAIFTVLIFLTYLTSDYFLWRQIQIIRDQLDQMRTASTFSEQSFRVQNRAYVWIGATTGRVTTNESGVARLEVTNYGKTPALKPILTSVCDQGLPVMANERRLRERGVRVSMPAVALLPDKENKIDISCKIAAVTENTGGMPQFSVWGKLEYQDVLGCRRWTRFCFIGDPRFPNEMHVCTGWYESDDVRECEKQ